LVEQCTIGLLLTCVSSLWPQSGRVRFRVTDRNGEAILTSEASRLGADDKPVLTDAANDTGEIVVTGLPLGFSRFAITAPHFQPRLLAVAIGKGSEQMIEATLEIIPPEYMPAVKTVQIQSPQTLDPAPAQTPKPAKHRWWQIFR
jgi:hypothetical protein